MTDDWHNGMACNGLNMTGAFFPAREPVYQHTPDGLRFAGFQAGQGDNHGRVAKAICAGCPVARPCLVDAVTVNEQHGIRGGAGGDTLRWLRRMFNLDGPDGPVFTDALNRHLDRLHGDGAPVDRNGPGAVHGRASTYARGCDCIICALAASDRGIKPPSPKRLKVTDLNPAALTVSIGRRRGTTRTHTTTEAA